MNPDLPKSSPIHFLVIAIVQEQDVEFVTQAVEAIAPVVYLASTGGFLGRRNATLLIGLPERMEEQVVKTLQDSCRRRVEYMTLPMEGSPLPLPAPVPVTVGGATVFAIPLEHFEEI